MKDGWDQVVSRFGVATPIKHLADFTNGFAFRSEDWSTEGTPIIRIENLNGSENFNCIKGTAEERYHVRAGDLLFSWSGNRGTSFGPYVWDQPGDWYLNQHIFKVTERGVDRRWLYWALSAATTYIEQQTSGIIGMVHVTKSELGSIPLPVPSAAEQRAIADYLDAETARIDALIAKKQQLIHLLEERLRAEMTELACGRLRGAPLVDSGIDWIGKIPETWQVVRLNKVARLESGHTPSRTREELWVGADKPWITLNDVGTLAESEFICETRTLISDAGLAASSARMLPAHTVVLSRDATIGRVGIMATDMATSQHFAAWVCSTALRPRFLWLLLRFAMQPFLSSFDDGATLRTIGMPHVRRFVVPLPPLEEQDEFVAQAETRRAAITAGGRSLGRQIELLAEHRQAIITAAVTGELSSAATG